MAVYNLILNGCPTGKILPVTNKIMGMITEYNSNNAWNVNGASGQVNYNNNKNNSYVVRGVAASGELYSILLESFVEAYHDCIYNKMSSPQCCEYRMNYEERLYGLYIQVIEGIYAPLKSRCFVVTRPLYREVFAADFQDRIIHHWICMRLEPLFEMRFMELGNVSHNCRKGFGTESAVQSLAKDIYDCSNGFTESCWIGRYDISGFFMSLDKEIAWTLLSDLINENYHETDKECLIYLSRITVFHLPQEHCIRNSPSQLWDKIPNNKSLFGNHPHKGMPIGNLPSQLIANFYMSFFDEFVLSLGFKYYERYADDFVIVHRDKAFILEAIPLFERFLWDKLKLKLHPDKRYLQHYTKGIQFVGAVIKMDRIYVGNRTIRNAVQTIRHINKELETGEELLPGMMSSLNSYFGFMGKRKSYAIRRKITKHFSPLLWEKIYMTNHFLTVKVKIDYDELFKYRREAIKSTRRRAS